MSLGERCSRASKALVLLNIFLSLLCGASPANQRLHSEIWDSETFELNGNTRPVVVRGVAQDQGPVASSRMMPRMFLHFAMTAAQRADLDQLLKAQQDRRSPHYHQFLIPEQFATRFGLDNADIGRVTRWLEDRGFSGLEVGRSHSWVSFFGTVGQVEAAFHTSIHQYSLRGETHVANAKDPELPKALQSVVESVGGLHNFGLRPQLVRLHPQYTTGSGDHFVAPTDWVSIYDVDSLYSAGWDGTGTTVAVVGQSDVQLSDIRAFRSAAGLLAHDPTTVIPTGDQDPGIQSASGDEAESDIDIEWAGAIAKNADILFVTASATTGNGVVDAITYAIDNNVAPIISTSYGLCEPDESTNEFQSMQALFEQANAQGITILAASGDVGAAACDTSSGETTATRGLAVVFPASSQYVTAVGGTEFNEGSGGDYWLYGPDDGSAGFYIPETAWNDGFALATGGGASALIAKPSWQVGPGVPADNARDVPDVAFAASPNHDGLLFCGHNWCTNGFLNSASYLDVSGGTSVAAPSFAGLLALVLESGKPGTLLGNINPNLYSLAQVSNDAFHDIVTGNNYTSCQTGTKDCSSGQLGFAAGTGYDQATGLGSVEAENFAREWYGDFSLTANPATLTMQPGTSATASVTLSPINGFSGNVSFTCSSSLDYVTCSVPSTPLNTSGTITVTIVAGLGANTIPKGAPKGLPPIPRGQITFAGLALAALVLVLPVLALQRNSVFSKRYIYVCSSLFVLAIGAVTVSCGSGTSSGGGNTAQVVTPLAITCTVPSGAVGVAYQGTCVSSGGTAPAKFSISNGDLPSGLALGALSGQITGQPLLPGTSAFTVMATDSAYPPHSATQAAKLAISPATLVLSCNIPGSATRGANYSGSCSPMGGTAPFAWSISAGALPVGIRLDQSGMLSGWPVNAGTSQFTVKATDSSTPEQSATYQSSITAVNAPLGLSCAFGSGIVGQLYNDGCYASGGDGPPYLYSLIGSVPPGLSFSTAVGLLTGTPTAVGNTSFTVKVNDYSSPPQTVSKQINLAITSPPPQNGAVTVWAMSAGGAISKLVSIAVAVQ